MKKIRNCTTRTRGGCITCKQRRKKCDEQRPSCSNCVTSKRVCLGYSDPFRCVNEVSSAAFDRTVQCIPDPWLQISAQPDDYQAASFHCLSGSIFHQVHGNLICEILRRQKSQESIRHALLALSVQLEAFARDHRLRSVNHTDREYSLQHYGRSLREVQSVLKADMNTEQQIEVLLVLSLIISYELLRGNGPAALTHLEGALCVVAASSNSSSPKSNLAEMVEDIRMLYLRLEIHVLSFVGSRAPTLSASSNKLLQDRARLNHYPEDRATMESLNIEFMRLRVRALQALRTPNAAQHPTNTTILSDLHIWFQSFSPLMHTAIQPPASKTSKEYRLLHMQYLVLTMSLSAWHHDASYQELPFDNFQALFSALLQHAESIFETDDASRLFTLEPVLIEPLYFTVLKCREPTKRIIALHLLSRCRQEAAWDGPLMTSIARHVMQMEAVLVRYEGDVEGNTQRGGPGDLVDDAQVVWEFRHDPRAEMYRVCSTALVGIDWERRNALVETCYKGGRNYAECSV